MKFPPLREVLRAARKPGPIEAASIEAGKLVERTLGSLGLAFQAGGAALARPVVRSPVAPWRPRPAPGNGADSGLLKRQAEGGRPYRLHIPEGFDGQALPLVVMLHGCSQTPEDFALGTGMNRAADEAKCFVAYPEQIMAANASRCWNWFNSADQARDQGEPVLIAAITREVMRHYPIDPARVYVAGLSAGGAAAAVMGALYPDLYAAIGVHSGLPFGAAHNATSAFAAMRDGVAATAPAPRVPTIIFHGDHDTTVNPRNADSVAAQFAAGVDLARHDSAGQAPGGRSWRKTVLTDAAGQDVLEQWTVLGLGHAWSGGSKAGSYTDPTGPDASREMLRFFLRHRQP